MLIEDFSVIHNAAVTLEMWVLKLWCILLRPAILNGFFAFLK